MPPSLSYVRPIKFPILYCGLSALRLVSQCESKQKCPQLSVLRRRQPRRKAGEARRGLDLPRRDLFLWVCAIIFFNQLLAAVNQLPSASPGQAALRPCRRQYFSDHGVVRHISPPCLKRSDASRANAGHSDRLGSLPPPFPARQPEPSRSLRSEPPFFSWIRGRGDPKLRGAGVVLAALTIQEYWGHIVFDLFALPLLRAETAVVGTLVQAVRAGTVWQGNVITGPSGFGIIVYSGCSSFHNLSLAMLCWLTVSRLRNQSWRSRDLLTGVRDRRSDDRVQCHEALSHGVEP